MKNEMRKMIDQVKNIGNKLNENVRTEPTTVGEIRGILRMNGIQISDKEDYYNGSDYREKYTIIGSDDVDGKTPYMNIPTKVKSQGFITKNGVLQNFFFYNGTGFDTTKSINEFLKWVG